MARWNKVWTGLIAGLIGPVFGYLTFYLITSNHMPLKNFNRMILNTSDTHSAIISVSLIFNLIFFFGALKLDWMYSARGVIFATLIYAAMVVFLKYG